MSGDLADVTWGFRLSSVNPQPGSWSLTVGVGLTASRVRTDPTWLLVETSRGVVE